ncbi:hypothetical protein ScPMuIL_018480 [Solemya velum]
MKTDHDNNMVDYTFLGNSGLKVSNLCLGAMNFGKSTGTDFLSKAFGGPTQANEELSFQILDKYAELGGNFIDTADVYSFGKSEEIIGDWLMLREREKFVIATKVRSPMDLENINNVGLSRRHIIQSAENSIRRLKTDYIDLYQIHLWDDAVPIEETMRAMDDLIRSGKVRYFGVSNLTGWQLQKIVDIAKYKGLSPAISLQQNYNLMVRSAEVEAFKVCQNEGIGVIPYSPLAGGLLTGKFKRGEELDPTTSRVGYSKANNASFFDYPMDDKYWALIDELKSIAEAKNKTIPQVSLRWVLQKDIVAAPIIGATSVKQLESNMAAAKGWSLSQEEMKKLDDLSACKETYPYDLTYKFNFGRQNPYKK